MTTVQPFAASPVSTFLYELRLSDFFHLHCVENYGIKFIIYRLSKLNQMIGNLCNAYNFARSAAVFFK